MENINTNYERKDVLVYIGTFNENNIYRLDKEKSLYSPFIKNFNSMYDFMKWQRNILSTPLLRDKYLAIVNIRATYIQFESIVDRIYEFKNEFIKLIVIIEPRDKFFNLPHVNFEIIDLSKTIRDDFLSMIRTDLPNLKEDGERAILKRIGYNFNAYKLYKEDLQAAGPLDYRTVVKIIKEVRIRPIEDILYMMLKHEKARGYREHRRLSEKYSENWVIKMYIQNINNVIDAKRKLITNELTFSDIHSNQNYRRLRRLIRDTKITDVYLLKYFLEKYSNFGLEIFLTLDDPMVRLDYAIKKVEYKSASEE